MGCISTSYRPALAPHPNPSEMDNLVPAPGGVAQKATGLFPGLDHCTHGGEGGTRGSFTHISTEWLHQCACPQGGRDRHTSSPIPPGVGLTFAEVTCATITGVTITPADVSQEPPSTRHVLHVIQPAQHGRRHVRSYPHRRPRKSTFGKARGLVQRFQPSLLCPRFPHQRK